MCVKAVVMETKRKLKLTRYNAFKLMDASTLNSLDPMRNTHCSQEEG